MDLKREYYAGCPEKLKTGGPDVGNTQWIHRWVSKGPVICDLLRRIMAASRNGRLYRQIDTSDLSKLDNFLTETNSKEASRYGGTGARNRLKGVYKKLDM